MSRHTLIAALVSAVERLNATGDSWGWPTEEIARIAIRRWDSYSRRHRKAAHPTAEERIADLAKGMRAHFEPGIPYTSGADWRALSETLTKLLQEDSDHAFEEGETE